MPLRTQKKFRPLARSLFLAASLLASSAFAFSLSDLSNTEATAGLKAAMTQSASAAVSQLGVKNGFFKNPKVKIPLPAKLAQARPVLSMLGKEKQLDDLELAMNRAAESAVPKAKPLFIKAVKSMSVEDAKKILQGGDTAVTDFFRHKTSDDLTKQFLPIVKKITDRNKLSTQYNTALKQVSGFGLVKDHPTVESYVTQKALDGLFTMIAEEEKQIRQDPVGSGSKIIGKVFGALK